jgi:hypothetical protein
MRLVVISGEMVLKPLPGIACRRATAQLVIQREAQAVAHIEQDLAGVIIETQTVQARWQRCPNRDNIA